MATNPSTHSFPLLPTERLHLHLSQPPLILLKNTHFDSYKQIFPRPCDIVTDEEDGLVLLSDDVGKSQKHGGEGGEDVVLLTDYRLVFYSTGNEKEKDNWVEVPLLSIADVSIWWER